MLFTKLTFSPSSNFIKNSCLVHLQTSTNTMYWVWTAQGHIYTDWACVCVSCLGITVWYSRSIQVISVRPIGVMLLFEVKCQSEHLQSLIVFWTIRLFLNMFDRVAIDPFFEKCCILDTQEFHFLLKTLTTGICTVVKNKVAGSFYCEERSTQEEIHYFVATVINNLLKWCNIHNFCHT